MYIMYGPVPVSVRFHSLHCLSTNCQNDAETIKFKVEKLHSVDLIRLVI